MVIWGSLLLAFTGLFLVRQRGQVASLRDVMQQADPRWLAAAVVAQLFVLLLAGVTYRIVLRRLGHALPTEQLVAMHLQRHVVGTVTPAGGPASVYVFIRALGRHQVPTEDALLAATLRSVAGYSSFVALLFPVLLLQHPSSLQLAGAGLLAVVLAMMLLGFILLVRPAGASARAHRHVPQRAASFVDRARGHRIRAIDLLHPFCLTLAANLVGVLVLYISLRAVGQHPSLLVPFAGYVIGTTLAMVAPVFGGIGMVEVSMALALQQAGVPGAAALSATLLFRLADQWLPLALGLVVQAGGRPSARRVWARTAEIGRSSWAFGSRPVERYGLGWAGASLIAVAPVLVFAVAGGEFGLGLLLHIIPALP